MKHPLGKFTASQRGGLAAKCDSIRGKGGITYSTKTGIGSIYKG